MNKFNPPAKIRYKANDINQKRYLVLFSLLLALFIAYNNTELNAKIYRLNNSQKIPSDFKDITSAMNAIKSGDTLYVEGSSESYGNLVVDKKIIFIGAGYNFIENDISNVHTKSAIFNNLIIEKNSDGSKLISLVFSSDSSSNQNVYVRSNNITIRNCLFKRNLDILLDSNIFNFAFIQNYTNESIKSLSTAKLENILIANNIVMHSIKFPTKSSIIITNNIVRKIITANNSTITNNIQLDSNSTKTFTAGFSGSNNLYKSNVSNNIDKYAPNPETNLLGVKMESVFEYFDADYSSIRDNIWNIKDSSPAKHIGSDGTECGIFGGSTPYKLSGLPPIPIVKDIYIDNSASNKDIITIKVKVK